MTFFFFGQTTKSRADEEKIAAPDFTLKDILTGKDVSLKDYKGKFVLVDFWATWCPPCQPTIGELKELQDKYKDKGLIVLGVSINEVKDTDDEKLAEFVKEKKINYSVMRADDKVLTAYFGNNPHHIPLLKFINMDGTIVDSHQGYEAGALEKKLKNFLK